MNLWKVNAQTRPRILEVISQLPEGTTVDLDVQIKRSNLQNNYYMGVVCVAAAENTSATQLQWHAYFKKMFGKLERFEINGVELEGDISTARMGTKEFGTYLDNVIMHCGELGIDVPPPTYFGLDKGR